MMNTLSYMVALRRARSNLQLAERGSRVKGVLLEDLCFNAQQAARVLFWAEKTIG